MRIRRCFTKLRIRCYKLEIEIGRFKKIPVESRFRPICNLIMLRMKYIFLQSVQLFQLKEMSSLIELVKCVKISPPYLQTLLSPLLKVPRMVLLSSLLW